MRRQSALGLALDVICLPQRGGFGGVTFTTYFRNSLIVTGISTVASVFSSAVVAYGFARIRFFGRGFWFAVTLATLMLPVQVQIIPQYIVFSKLGWINTYLPLIVPHFFGGAFFIFMMVQFIRGLPVELDEAAEMDGCSKVGIFWGAVFAMGFLALVPVFVVFILFQRYLVEGISTTGLAGG